MLFNTFPFVYFLPLVIILYYLIPHRFRWIMLLAASYYFYMCWQVSYIFLIIASTMVDYVCAILMEHQKVRKKRIALLIISLTVNLGLLFTFKYFDFFSSAANMAFQKINLAYHLPTLEQVFLREIFLPVGISFYTFQTLSYTIDVFMGKQKAEKHLGYFALYVAFFPQLVAGPIERFSRLAPQFRVRHAFSHQNISNGLRLVLYGLFIKMVIADNISGLVDQVYENPQIYGRTDILITLVLYSFQIYCDFFGYSSIAIGSARMMGIHIMDNFRTPYLAQNIAEFWQRWHISLSTWFRDYLYYPLGGNRVKKLRWVFNIFVVFIVSGLWHGANWTFLVWGGLFAVVYLTEKRFNKLLNLNRLFPAFSMWHILLALKTYIMVTFIWIFFRSESMMDALRLIKHLILQGGKISAHLSVPKLIWGLLGLFIISDILLYNKRFDTWIGKMPLLVRWSIYTILMFLIIVFSGVENFPFIYFQF